MKNMINEISNKQKLNKYKNIVKKINSYDEKFQKLTDQELKNKTQEFKERLNKKESLDSLLPEAYAAVKEASFRVLGMKPYDVQLIGAIALHNGDIAEMKTGEGKTLVATLPAYLNALTGQGVHVVTVNEYLAQRDAEEMGQVHEFMGLSVGCVLNKMKTPQRQENYSKDITYLTNNELGFDYLRDNMVKRIGDKVQRGLNFVIIDEVDSILIDEARTPLIISGSDEDNSLLIKQINFLVSKLEKHTTIKEFSKIDAINDNIEEEKGDYVVNLKTKTTTLTEAGIQKAERFLRIPNLASPDYSHLMYLINASLRAYGLMRKDIDYVVKDGEVMIVDEFTGRIMDGRRYSNGIHQAIEAKEKVEIKPENKTLATITYQSLFNKYNKRSGMTGTAKTESKEFKETYSMDVVQIPTNRPVKRIDRGDILYPTLNAKYKAIIKEIKETHKTGQPILVGTADIETSEKISELLKAENIAHHVLNAKNNDKEAEIVSLAGKVNKVTIATNMAGRGTDIKLEEEAKKLGGLKVIGSERHESRRIDDQLRGRSGRQGDPGESVFFLSLEDNLLKLFGSERSLHKFKEMDELDNKIEDAYLTKVISSAQSKIESNNFATRKNLLEYDEVNNWQREAIYDERNKILAGEDISKEIKQMTTMLVDDIVDDTVSKNKINNEEIGELLLIIEDTFDISDLKSNDFKDLKKKDIKVKINELVKAKYKGKEEELQDDEQLRRVERQVLLEIIDQAWKEHLDNLDALRQWVNIRSYAQKKPTLEYKRLASKLFSDISKDIRFATIKTLYNMPIFYEIKAQEEKVIYDETEDGGMGFKITVSE